MAVIRFGLFLMALVVTVPGQAPPGGAERLTLAQAIDEALTANGLLAAGRYRQEAAAGLTRQALTGTNPRLILQSENTRTTEFRFFRDTDDFAYLQHTLETGGRRLKRGEVATAVESRLEQETAVLAAEVRARVKRAYWAAAGAQQTARWLEQELPRYADIVRYHEIRLREGAIAETDLLRVRLEESKLRVAISNAQLAEARTRIELQREMTRRAFAPLELVDPMADLALQPMETEDAAAALERRAEVHLSRALVRQMQANARLQGAVAKPNVDAVFGLKRVAGSFTTPSFTTLMGGLQMDLPFFNRNQGNIEASVADVRVAEATLAATNARIAAEVEAARRGVELRRAELNGIIAPLRAQAEESAAIAQAAYRIGGVDLLRLIDAERARVDAQLSYFQSLTDYKQSLAALEVALGLP